MTCRCGRERATAADLERYRSAVPADHPYAEAPSTWQLVRLGVCLAPDATHLDVPDELLAVCWSLTGNCMAPRSAA